MATKSTVFCTSGKDLVKKATLEESRGFGPYDSVLVQKCFEEVDEHHRMIMSTLSRVRDSGIPWEEAAPTDWAKIVVHSNCVLRIKRCLMAYHISRMKKLQELRWRMGPSIESGTRTQSSAQELEFFKRYDKMLASYMRSVEVDLTLDSRPPNETHVNVQGLLDYGEMMLEDGNTVILAKGSFTTLRRAEAERLVNQGLIKVLD